MANALRRSPRTFLNLSQVYAVLAYYHAKLAEVEQELADELAEFDCLKAQ